MISPATIPAVGSLRFLLERSVSRSLHVLVRRLALPHLTILAAQLADGFIGFRGHVLELQEISLIKAPGPPGLTGLFVGVDLIQGHLVVRASLIGLVLPDLDR